MVGSDVGSEVVMVVVELKRENETSTIDVKFKLRFDVQSLSSISAHSTSIRKIKFVEC